MSTTPSIGQRFTTKHDPFTVTRYDGPSSWAVKWDDGLVIAAHGEASDESFDGYCDEFEAVPETEPAK